MKDPDAKGITMVKQVADIIEPILDSCKLDYNNVTKIELVDGGNAFEIVFTGAVDVDTLRKIGETFRDENFNIYTLGEDKFLIVLMNNMED